MPSYFYFVQDETGREVVSAHVDVEKVSDVHAELVESEADGDTGAALFFEDLEIARGSANGQVDLTLHRTPSDDKLAKPVSHPVQ